MKRYDPFERPPIPGWFKLLATLAAIVGLGFLGVVVWTIVTLVGWVTSQ